MLGALVVTEELWRADAGVGGSIAAADFGTEMLLAYDEEWMREEWLPPIAAGETHIATAISEPAHGSNVAGMETRAERDGGEWVIDGTEMWNTNGTVADVMIVMAKTTPGAGHGDITAFLTRRTQTGSAASASRTSSASSPRTPRSSSSTASASPTRTSAARSARGSTS